MPSNRLSRSSSLKRQRLIRALFARSKGRAESVSAGSISIRFRVVDRLNTGGAKIQIGFAPSRKTSSKVVRNRIRRTLRESYRLHQHALLDLFDDRSDSLTAMFMYRGKEERLSERIRTDLPKALNALIDRLSGIAMNK